MHNSIDFRDLSNNFVRQVRHIRRIAPDRVVCGQRDENPIARGEIDAHSCVHGVCERGPVGVADAIELDGGVGIEASIHVCGGCCERHIWRAVVHVEGSAVDFFVGGEYAAEDELHGCLAFPGARGGGLRGGCERVHDGVVVGC